MLIIPKTKQPQRRIKVAAPTPAPTPAALTVSAVTEVSFDGPAGSLVVGFSMTAGAYLNDPSGSDPSKWTARVNGTVYIGSQIIYDGGAVMTLLFSDYGNEPGPDVLSYSAEPSDISDSMGQELQAFENFPI